MTLIPPTGSAGRAVRGGVVGVATGALAVVAHVEATGSPPDVGLIALPVLLLAVTAAALAGRERGPAQILGLVGAGQVAMHALLSLPVPHDHSARTSDSGALMVLGHVLATLVVVAVLACAERAVFAVTAALASALPRKLAPAAVSGPPRTVSPATVWLPKAEASRCGEPTRRGPPLAH